LFPCGHCCFQDIQSVSQTWETGCSEQILEDDVS
jgi:hypothetical protein